MRLFWFCAQKPIRFTSFRLQFPGASGPNAARVYDSKMGALGESDEEDPDDAECARPVASFCASLALCICMVGMGERVNASGVQTVFRFSGGDGVSCVMDRKTREHVWDVDFSFANRFGV